MLPAPGAPSDHSTITVFARFVRLTFDLARGSAEGVRPCFGMPSRQRTPGSRPLQASRGRGSRRLLRAGSSRRSRLPRRYCFPRKQKSRGPLLPVHSSGRRDRARDFLPESRLRQPQEVHSRPGWAEAEPSVDLLCPRGVVGRYPKVSDVTGSLDRVTRQRRAAPAATGIGVDVHLGDLGTFARGLRIAASYCWRSKWKSLLQEDVRLCRRDRARGRA